MFKESRYNLFTDLDAENVIVINAATAATVVLSRESAEQLHRAAAGNIMQQLPLLWLCQLLRLGFIVPVDLDEIAGMHALSSHTRHTAHRLGLTICPTMACNLACTYCYQSPNRCGPMDRETGDAILRFVREQLPESSTLQIHWYGGEPLLERKLVFELTERLHEQAKRSNCEFRLGLVTNGTLLDQDTLEYLESHNLESVQVTLDGPGAIHDRRKPMTGGNGSFDVIVNNLVGLKPRRARLRIRMNVDDTNVDAIPELIDYVRDSLPDSSVYPAPVVRGLATCSDAAEHCIDNSMFAAIERSVLQQIWKAGLGGEHRPFQARSYHCGASTVSSYTVDPGGYLYKCWNHPGNPEHAVGHVALPLDLARSAAWLNNDPYIIEQCRQCKFLPLCNGGCSYQALVNNNRMCDRRKHYLKELLTRRLEVLEQG